PHVLAVVHGHSLRPDSFQRCFYLCFSCLYFSFLQIEKTGVSLFEHTCKTSEYSIFFIPKGSRIIHNYSEPNILGLKDRSRKSFRTVDKVLSFFRSIFCNGFLKEVAEKYVLLAFVIY